MGLDRRLDVIATVVRTVRPIGAEPSNQPDDVVEQDRDQQRQAGAQDADNGLHARLAGLNHTDDRWWLEDGQGVLGRFRQPGVSLTRGEFLSS